MTTSIDWGGDLNDLPDGDMDPEGRDLDGTDVEVMKQDLFRRYTNETGGIFYALEHGYNLRALLSDAATPDGRKRIERILVDQALLDERIESAEAEVQFEAQTEEAVITVNCFGALGPFDLVMKITDVTIERLNQAG
jgi:hypothetical protein